MLYINKKIRLRDMRISVLFGKNLEGASKRNFSRERGEEKVISSSEIHFCSGGRYQLRGKKADGPRKGGERESNQNLCPDSKRKSEKRGPLVGTNKRRGVR